MDALIVLAFVIGYVLLSWAILRGGTGRIEPVPPRGRHRMPEVAKAVHLRNESWDVHVYGIAPDVAATLTVVGDRTQPYPQLVIPRHVTEHPAGHTSPSESLRGRCEVDTPIFAALAKELGLDQMLVAA